MMRPTVDQTNASLGTPVSSREVSWELDGFTLKACVSVREHKGRELVAAPDLERAELQAALKLVELRHAGPEGLRFIRKACGVSLKSFAEALGVNERTMRRWEAGEGGNMILAAGAYFDILREKAAGRDPIAKLEAFRDAPPVRPGTVINVGDDRSAA